MNICLVAELAHLDPLIFHYFPVLEVICSQCGKEFPLVDFNVSEADNYTYKSTNKKQINKNNHYHHQKIPVGACSQDLLF